MGSCIGRHRARLARGDVARSVYMTQEMADRLRARFPGQNGGICWKDLFAAALATPDRWAAPDR